MASPIEVEIKNLISTNKFVGGVFLGNEDKTFAIFIGPDEMNALVLAGQGIDPPRPLTHNLIQSILLGFDIELKRAVVSDLVDETFTATVILERQEDEDDETTRHEVRIDCRPSDAMVLATLSDRPIYVEPHVFDEVDDQGELLEALKAQVMEEIQKKVSTFQKGQEEGEGEESSPSNRVAEYLDPSDVEEFEGIQGIEDFDLDVDLDPDLDLGDDDED